jgi:hypothetical protein
MESDIREALLSVNTSTNEEVRKGFRFLPMQLRKHSRSA